MTEHPTFNIEGCQTYRKDQMNLNDQKKDQVLQAAYEWRAAVVHRAACNLKIRDGDVGAATVEENRKLSELWILLDSYSSDLTALDYVVDL